MARPSSISHDDESSGGEPLTENDETVDQHRNQVTVLFTTKYILP
jgi:hypothetical protein